MKKNYFQSQYILNRCFDNVNDILKVTLNSSQDYLNAVYDQARDALRVNVVGGVMPPVPDHDSLPPTADSGQLCPVYNDEKKCVEFYEWRDGEWVYRGSTISDDGTTMDERQQAALDWTADHLDQLKEVAGFDYIVKVEDVVLSPDSTVAVVQGAEQDVDDDLDTDGDADTPYRIDFSGYVMTVDTYADAEAVAPDRYYTRITYETGTGSLGTSHIYIAQDEYEYFANLPDGKNILRVYYLTNATTSPIKRQRYVLRPDMTAVDADGVEWPVEDADDADGDPGTVVRIPAAGYVLGAETYAAATAPCTDRYYTKLAYESDGVHPGRSYIYMDREEYDFFSGLPEGKNVMDIYYVATVFPASVTISETQLRLPATAPEYYAVGADGVMRNVADLADADGDEETLVRIRINGYVLDADAYYGDDDPVRKRLLVKMSYRPDLDVTDIYFGSDVYTHVSSLPEGRNFIGIYSLGAGIGVDASRLPSPSAAVSAELRALREEVAELRRRIDETGG